jgi:DNA-binding NarL/FixJ family response regulator
LNYKNAKDVLPQELIDALQEYAAGELLYIPSNKEKRRSWGEKSGAKEELRKRNHMIASAFTQGQSFEEIAQCFCLSPDSVRKIIYLTAVK